MRDEKPQIMNFEKIYILQVGVKDLQKEQIYQLFCLTAFVQ
jgi:hypothetical protein